jgi:replicative DNA helicase
MIVRMDHWPANLDAERLVLGSILLNDALYDHVAETLTSDDYSVEKHRRIARRMGELHARGENIDRVTVANELDRLKELEACDGLSYLVSLDDGLPQFPNIDSYIRIVKDKAVLRRIIQTSQHTMTRCLQDAEDPDEILSGAEKAILELRASRSKSRSWTGTDLVGLVLEMAEQRKRQFEKTGKPVMGIQSGLPGLDRILNGFEVGLHLLAGGPGAGKTTLCLQMGVHACECGTPVVYVSYENGARNLVLKAICMRAGIVPRDIERGNAHVSVLA